jgi:FMN reductase
MSGDILFLGGSPSPTSRSTLVARAVASEVQVAGFRPIFWSLGDFDPGDVLFARTNAPAATRFIEDVRSATALVLSTPVYKAAYTGALKAIVDLIPPDALVGRPALGIATGKLPAHGGEVDRAFLALFAFFRARALETLFVLDAELELTDGGGILSARAEQRVRLAGRSLAATGHRDPEATVS